MKWCMVLALALVSALALHRGAPPLSRACSARSVPPALIIWPHHLRSPVARLVATTVLAPRRARWRDSGLLQELTRIVRWLRTVLCRLRDALFGSLSPARGSARRLDAAACLRKMPIVQGVATRTFPPPDEAYTGFDYCFSPFYAELGPVDNSPSAEEPSRLEPPLSSDNAGGRISWLGWADAKPRTDLEWAVDFGRLALLRRIRVEAIEIERQTRRRVPLLPVCANCPFRTCMQ